jgi:hypothetical protein
MHEEPSLAYHMEGWKAIDAFQTFHYSVEGFDQQAKIKQTLKCNLFLMIARRAVVKQFKVWMNDVLFLAIYAEAPTGGIVAKYLPPPSTLAAAAPAGLTNDMQIFESPIHGNRQIDLKKFATFIAKQCQVQTALRAGPHVFPQCFPIQYFANSVHGMWDDDAPLVLSQLKQNYLVDYAALLSNTHLAESNVKDANLCQIKCLAENLSMTFLTTQSGIVGSLNESNQRDQNSKRRHVWQ